MGIYCFAGRIAPPLRLGLAVVLMLAVNINVFAVVFSNPAPITINDPASPIGLATPYPSNIVVSGMVGTITDVNVTLNNVNHTFPADIDILLVSPGGQNFILMSDAGGGPDLNNTNITFDNEAAAPLPQTLILSGSYRPTNYGVTTDTFPAPAPGGPYNNPGPGMGGSQTLPFVFNGTAPNGTWSLYVVDAAEGDVGTIADGWSLTISSDNTAATTFANSAPIRINDHWGKATPYPSNINVTGLTGRITDLNVTLTNVNHSFPQDIVVLLVGPRGQNLVLMAGAVGDDLVPLEDTTLTFDDSAADFISEFEGAPTGSYKPAAYLGIDFPAPAPLSPANFPTIGSGSTLATAFNGTDPNGIWSLYTLDLVTGDTGDISGGWSMDITAGGQTRRITHSDFDGDLRADISVWNPTTHNWTLRDSSTLKYRTVVDWGAPGDRIVPGDYDGDTQTDVAVWRPSEGNWYIQQSSGPQPNIRRVGWGNSSDIPVQADYDRDGRVDIAVWRPSEGNWYILQSNTGTVSLRGWGASGDVPVPGDYDGDGFADAAVYRPSEGNWYIQRSSGGATVKGWGAAGDQLVPADYDGDLKTDIAVFRPSEGNWYIINSATGDVTVTGWGQSGDSPIPADYDGDGRADIAVWRGSEGNWYILQSAIIGFTNNNRLDKLGFTNNVPTPLGYLPAQ